MSTPVRNKLDAHHYANRYSDYRLGNHHQLMSTPVRNKLDAHHYANRYSD